MARPINEVFDFIGSPLNPELEKLNLSGPLSRHQEDPELARQLTRFGITLVEYSPPSRLKWQGDFDYTDVAGSCTYELTATSDGIAVIQRYGWPLPPLIFLPALPVLWCIRWAEMRQRLRKAKSILESN